MVLAVARIRQPQLVAGPLDDFFTALHDLHLKAGYPSTREIQRDIGRQLVSHTTIHKAFSGPRLPGWLIVEQLIEALAERSRQDIDTVIEKFRSLWEHAARSLHDAPNADADKVRVATQVARESIQHRAARPFAEVMSGTLDEIEAAGTRKVNRELVPTGFADVDSLTGGMRAGSLVIIASRPSIGKSIMLTTICTTSAVRYALPTAMFSSETTEREIQMRILSAEARVPYHWVRTGQMGEEEWTRLARRMADIVDAPLWLFHSSCLEIDYLESEARSLSSKYQLRLVAIDNLDDLVGSDNKPAETLYRLKQLGADLQVPVLATARMKNPSSMDTPMHSEINELWNADLITGIADVVVVLDRPDAYNLESPRAGEVDLIFAKNRYGPTATVTLAFQGHYSRMVDLFISDDGRPDWSFVTPKAADAKDVGSDGEGSGDQAETND